MKIFFIYLLFLPVISFSQSEKEFIEKFEAEVYNLFNYISKEEAISKEELKKIIMIVKVDLNNDTTFINGSIISSNYLHLFFSDNNSDTLLGNLVYEDTFILIFGKDYMSKYLNNLSFHEEAIKIYNTSYDRNLRIHNKPIKKFSDFVIGDIAFYHPLVIGLVIFDNKYIDVYSHYSTNMLD